MEETDLERVLRKHGSLKDRIMMACLKYKKTCIAIAVLIDVAILVGAGSIIAYAVKHL